MIVTLRTERIRTLDQIRAFLDGSEPADFRFAGRDSAYDFVRRTLVRFEFHGLKRDEKGLVKRFIEKVTGYSRAQITRLVKQHRRTGGIRDHRKKPPAKPFPCRYTPYDAALLAEVDEAFGQLSGPATKVVLWRMYHVYGDRRFKRLAGISNGHIYNLRKSRAYRTGRLTFRETRSTPVGFGVRRKPRGRTAGPAFCALTPSTSAIRVAARAPTSSTSSTKPRSSNTLEPSRASPSSSWSPCAEGPHLRLSLHRQGLPRRQRLRVHQPRGRRPAQPAPHPHLHQIPAPPVERQRARRVQERQHRPQVARPHPRLPRSRPPARRLPPRQPLPPPQLPPALPLPHRGHQRQRPRPEDLPAGRCRHPVPLSAGLALDRMF